MLNQKGYFIDSDLRLDRQDTANGIGGGLIVYCKEGINVIPLTNGCDFNQYKTFCVKGNNCANDVYITLVYRSPNSNNVNNDALCNMIKSLPKNSIVIGDFNMPHVNWSTHSCGSKFQNFLDALDEKSLDQIIDFPTHVRGNILDLLLTDMPEKILDVKDVGNLGSSDHCILLFDMLFDCDYSATSQMLPDWQKADNEGLENYLNSINWQCINNVDTESGWNFFKTKIQNGIEKYVPFKPRRKKGKPCWITKDVTKLSRKKQKLWKRFSKNRTSENFSLYKSAEKDFKKAVRNAKRNFEKKISKVENQKSFNAYVKTKTKNRVPIGPIKCDDQMLCDDKDIADEMNDYFSSVFTRTDNVTVPNAPVINPNCKIYSVHFTPDRIERKIDKLKPTPACGPDGISTTFLKRFKSVVKYPLSYIFNKSMFEGTVPEDWRCANITPIFKNKGSRSDCSNYRPVSLTCIPCRLMESCVKDDVLDFCIKNNFFLRLQHGFLPKRNCATNLLEFFEFVTSNVDNGNPIDCIYLDFCKAFDKVPIEKLLAKLKSHGINGQLLKWFRSWLTNRRQRVVINGKKSEWANVTSGVPQGSVLGPLAFVIFINDLDLSANPISIVNKFADDTKIGHIVQSQQEQIELQNCLNRLCSWADEWGMQFNVKKCNVIHFGRNNHNFEYKMNDVLLTSVSEERDVGVKITSNLKPSKHCVEIANKAKAILRQISKSFHYRDKKTFLNLYKTYVRCHLEYCTPVWSPHSQADIDLLERVQKKAVGMISGLNAQDYEARLEELGLLSLKARRERFDMIQTYKIMNRIDDVNSETWFERVQTNRNISTRLTSCDLNLVNQRSHLDIRKNFFSNRVVNSWNKLPTEVKRAPNLISFKSLYDEYIKSTG